VAVVSFQPGEIDGAQVFQLPSLSSRNRINIFLNLVKVRHLVKKIAPDILHAHYVTSYGLAGAVSGWRPFIVTAWGDDVLVSPEESLLYRMIVRWVLGRADLVTSMAEHMTKFMNKRLYSAPKRILTLPFGVDTEQFNRGCRLHKHGDAPAKVVSTRNLEDEYDVETYIRAIPLVLDKRPDARFLVAGDGGLRLSLEKLAIDLRIEKHTEFLGKIPYKEMPHLLGGADVFVTTSISDGNNISLNEAMACGVFPVASDIPANREWIEHGKNGLIFPVGDANGLAEAIVQALQEPEWRQSVVDKNWVIISQRGSWAKSMAKIEDYYRRLGSINWAEESEER